MARGSGAFAAFLLLQCQKEPSPGAAADSSSAAPLVTASAAPQDSVLPVAAAPSAAPSASAPSGSVAEAASPDDSFGGSIGPPLETPMYQFKVQEVKRCEAAAPQTDAAPSPLLIGLRVQVTAKVDQLPAFGRDITLEGGGVVYRSALPSPPGSRCTPLLGPKQLHANQDVSGFAVFTIPADVNLRGLTIAFQPTRWGGAPRVQMPLPGLGPAARKTSKTK
jgi:hypothetical protein